MGMQCEATRILVLMDYFLPGFRGGGPIRSIANLAAELGGEFHFLIVTRDRDLGSTSPYAGVKVDAWNDVGNARVFYASPGRWRPAALGRLVRGIPHDLLYLNSCFSRPCTILPLVLRRLGYGSSAPVILAPRGEFSEGALALKPRRKQAYIFISKLAGLYRGLWWQATAESEAGDIRRTIGYGAEQILVVPNLLSQQALEGRVVAPPPRRGALRLVFLSRISPKKNLEYLLKVLSEVAADLVCDVYGPIEDPAYWENCRRLIRALPANVNVRHRGELPPQQVHDVLTEYDLFVLPTLGENFGHVVAEALGAGTPVLISDRTPWRSRPNGGVRALPLEDRAAWVRYIEQCAALDDQSLARLRTAASSIARELADNQEAALRYRDMFHRAVAGRAGSAVPTSP